MLCKATLVMLPVVILLYAWWKHRRLGLRDLKASAPFFVISLVLGIVTIVFLNIHGMAAHPAKLGGPLSRIADAGLILSFYFSKAVLPVALVDLSTLENRSADAAPVPAVADLRVGIFLSLAAARRLGPASLLGLGFFAVNLLPFLGFTAGSYMSFTRAMDHILYLPIIGLIGLFVAGWERLLPLLKETGRAVAIGLLSLALALMAWGSHAYAQNYLSEEALWTYSLEMNADNWLAHIDLGNALYNKGRIDAAFANYEEALRIRPDIAEAYYNMGYALYRAGKFPEAIAYYKKALDSAPTTSTRGRISARPTTRRKISGRRSIPTDARCRTIPTMRRPTTTSAWR